MFLFINNLVDKVGWKNIFSKEKERFFKFIFAWKT